MYGKPGNFRENSNGTVHPGGNFPEKSNTFRGITLFPSLPEQPKFSVPSVCITSARLHVERRRKSYRYFVNGTTQFRSCFRCQKIYQYHLTEIFLRNFRTNGKRCRSTSLSHAAKWLYSRKSERHYLSTKLHKVKQQRLIMQSISSIAYQVGFDWTSYLHCSYLFKYFATDCFFQMCKVKRKLFFFYLTGKHRMQFWKCSYLTWPRCCRIWPGSPGCGKSVVVVVSLFLKIQLILSVSVFSVYSPFTRRSRAHLFSLLHYEH